MPEYPHHKVWLNTKIVPPEKAAISVFAQTVQRGANVYEGIRAYWNEERKNLFVWKLDAHLRRLFQSMKVMRMTPPFTVDVFRDGVLEWIRANDFREDVHFYMYVYFGDGGPLAVKAYRPEEIDTGAFILGGPRRRKESLEKGIRLCVSNWRRIGDDVVPPRVKAGANYQNSRLAGVEARANGFDDAVLLNREGRVAEVTSATLMIVRDGRPIAPPITEGILESITRTAVLEMSEKYLERTPVERPVDRTELYIAEEVFICGSAEEVTPVVSIDHLPVGGGTPGPFTQRLQEVFFQAVRGYDEGYEKDLIPVY